MRKIFTAMLVCACVLWAYTSAGMAERIENTYGYTLKGDPYNSMQIQRAKDPFMGNVVNEAYYLRDEDFFGKFSDGEWTGTGKLNYNNIPDVEMAVKSGDYSLAKEELLEYYKSKNYKKDTTSSSADIMTADLLTKNFMYNARSGLAVQSYIYVDGTAKYTSADVSSAFRTYASSRSQMSFMVLADDKDKYTVSFGSKESGNSPYIKVVSGGIEKILYPIDDTYINASSYASKNYGSSAELQACESAIGTSNLVNVYTKRIYLKFDTSGLGNITSATLYMNGYNKSADAKKELVVFYTDDSSWEEESATYNNVTPQVIYSYDQDDTWGWNKPSGSGSRYSEELLRFDTWFDKLVKAYNSTGDEKYAYTALRQLMDFINVRGDEPTHLVTLDVAVRMQCLPKLFMQLLHSEYMTPDIFTAFMKYMYVEANAAKNFTRGGNWGTSESVGLFIGAVYFREFADSDLWIDRVRVRYESLMGNIVNSDFSCIELSLGYVDYTISTIIGAKEAADELGTDISPYSELTLENLEKLGLYMYYMSMPGIRDNQMGDGYSYTGSYKNRLLYLGKWFNNPELLYAGTGGADGEMPQKTSMLFPVGRKAVMRSDWTNNALYLYTNVDGGIGNHGHADDNAIVLYAYGKYLLVDPLYGTYSATDEKTWLTSSIAHNTVTMNGKNQYYASGNAAKGEFEKWETNDGYDFIKETTKNVPDAEKYTRSILSVKDKFYIVNDHIVPKNTTSNKYVQAWHFLPSANISIDPDNKATSTNMSGANLEIVPVNAAAISRAGKVSGLYSSGQGSIQNANYTEYEKNLTGNVCFDTILIPKKSGAAKSSVTYEMLSDNADVTAYELNIDSEKYIYIQNHSEEKLVTVGDYQTDADMLLAGFNADGDVDFIAATEISCFKYKENDILSSQNSLSAISVSVSENCEINGSKLDEVILGANNVSVYAPGISRAYVNGSLASVKKYGGNIFFGDDAVSGFEYPLLYDVSAMNYEYDTEIKITELSKYGFNYDTTKALYSVRKINSEKSVYRDALRFGTRQFSTTQNSTEMVSISFLEDSVNCPESFENGRYIFESEFAIQNKDSGEIRLSFNDGDSTFARVCFKKTNYGSYIHSGKAYAVNSDGKICGTEQEIKITSDSSLNTAGCLFYIKAEIDTNAGEMSIWLVPRAFGKEDYQKILASDKYLLVADMPIDIQRFDKITFDVTKNKYENSVWLSNLSVSKLSDISAKIDISDVFSSEKPSAYAKLYNPFSETILANLIVSQFDENDRLIKTDIQEINTAELNMGISVSDNADYIKAFVWSDVLFPYDFKEIYR